MFTGLAMEFTNDTTGNEESHICRDFASCVCIRDSEPIPVPSPIEEGRAEAFSLFPNAPIGPAMHSGVSGVVPAGGSGESQMELEAAAVTNAIEQGRRATNQLRAACQRLAATRTHVPLITAAKSSFETLREAVRNLERLEQRTLEEQATLDALYTIAEWQSSLIESLEQQLN